jgi:hypothetical protein
VCARSRTLCARTRSDFRFGILAVQLLTVPTIAAALAVRCDAFAKLMALLEQVTCALCRLCAV